MTFKFLSLFIFLYLIFLPQSAAQNFNSVIQGKVTVKSSNRPLENVTVYISGTAFGTATDSSGFFMIESLPFGTHKLVASMLGYKPEGVYVDLKEGMIAEVNFGLEETYIELDEVIVKAKLSVEWKDNLEVFKKYFLGRTQFASDCRIINPEVIDLFKSDSGELTARASQSIMVINNALGYKLFCDLIDFNWNEKEHIIRLHVDSYSMELKDSSGNLKKEWIKNRRKAFYGSSQHFFKSLIKNNLSGNGFTIFYQISTQLRTTFMQQFDRDEICFVENNLIRLRFNDYLRIEYYSDYNKTAEVSWIKLCSPEIKLDKYGYPDDPYSFDTFGYWSQLGIACKLPKYFNL